MAPSETQDWRFVYMRNMDIRRVPPGALGHIWSALGLDGSKVGGASSIGPYLSEIIVAPDYADTLGQALSTISTPQLLDDSLRISVDREYVPLAPHAHMGAPESFRLPDHARDALDRYTRESVARRWSAMYHASREPGVRRFILAQMEEHVLGSPAPRHVPQEPLGSRQFSSADLVSRRSRFQGELGKDHLAELVPLPSASRIVVYVDGALLPHRNTAGMGAYFVDVDIAPMAQRLLGFQSAARAEIYAMAMALEKVRAHLAVLPSPSLVGEVWVCSDSRYAVDGVNVYREPWETNAWLTAKGKPVANRNAFQALYSAIDLLQSKGHNVFIHHLPAHAGIIGNEIADMLAKAGALVE